MTPEFDPMPKAHKEVHHRRDMLYLFQGRPVWARSKDQVLRLAGLLPNGRNYALVTKVRPLDK